MLMKFSGQFRHGKNGFTMIEILIVVAILGVLAAVAIPNVAKFIGTGKTEAANTELTNMQSAVIAYMADKHFGYATVDGTAGGTVITLSDLTPYLFHTPHGTYDFTGTGGVTQVSYP
jgi:type IV pilus assembly protein PilA